MQVGGSSGIDSYDVDPVYDAASGELPVDRFLDRRAVVAALQPAGARAGRGRERAAAGAGPLRGHLRLQPRRVLHGAGRRAQAPDGRRASPCPAPAGCSRARCSSRSGERHHGADAAARRACSATRSSRRWPTRASSCCAGTELDRDEQEQLEELFTERIFPVLTPLAVDPAHPFPYISGLSLNLAVLVRNPETGKEHFARVKVPPIFHRFVAVDDAAVRAARGRHRRAPRPAVPRHGGASTATPSG